ncbi:MAG: hypothetical protein F4Y57_02375 [Acidobacteria bacterium]|nr:hypothetical protein [Acidobacteriota bacterium]
MNVRVYASLLLLVGSTVGCGGDSPTSPSPTAPGGLAPRLSSIQSMIFNPRCIEHHGDHATEAGLDLTTGNAFANLVNVRSVQVALNLVTPNDAENSYLIHKIDGRTGIVGDRMPPDGPFLTTAQIDVIRQWINNGAPNN